MNYVQCSDKRLRGVSDSCMTTARLLILEFRFGKFYKTGSNRMRLANNAVSNMVTKETWNTPKGAGVKGMRHTINSTVLSTFSLNNQPYFYP